MQVYNKSTIDSAPNGCYWYKPTINSFPFFVHIEQSNGEHSIMRSQGQRHLWWVNPDVKILGPVEIPKF